MRKILFACLCAILVLGCERGKQAQKPALNENAVLFTQEISKLRIISSIMNDTYDVSDTIKAKTYGQYEVVDIEDIYFAADENIIDAERRFKEHPFMTSARVDGIGKSVDGPYMYLRSERLTGNTMEARFSSEEKDRISQVRKGQQITLVCEKAEFLPLHAQCQMFDTIIAQKRRTVETLINAILEGNASSDETFDAQTKRIYAIASKMPSDSACFYALNSPECRNDYKRAQAIYEKETGDKSSSADLKESVSSAPEPQNVDREAAAKTRANICSNFIANNVDKMAMTQFGYKADSFSVSETDLDPAAPNMYAEVKGLKLQDKFGNMHDVTFQCFVNKQTNEIFNVFLALGTDRDLFLTDDQLLEERRQQKLLYSVNPLFARPETSWAFTHPDKASLTEKAPADNNPYKPLAKACYTQVIKHLTPSPKAQKQWVLLSEEMNESEATFVAERWGHTIHVDWSKGMGNQAVQTCMVNETNAEGVEVFRDEGSDLLSNPSPVFFKKP